MRGTLSYKSPTEIIVDVQGVGYGISIPLSTYERLGSVQSTVTVLTYLHVREDALQLYGFATEEERGIFRLLISVSGIGPKMAQGILSGIGVADLRNHIMHGNLNALTAIPGVGKKLGERLIVELRDKFSKRETTPPVGEGTMDPQSQIRSEALLALMSLGYTRPAAERAVRTALQDADGTQLTLEALIKSSLKHAAK